jgi:hypothetical protein
MRRFGKRNDELGRLEDELQRRRPRARAEFLEENVSRINASTPSEPRGFTLRSRLIVAVVATGLLCVAAGATGGLDFASAASSHTVRAFTHALPRRPR